MFVPNSVEAHGESTACTDSIHITVTTNSMHTIHSTACTDSIHPSAPTRRPTWHDVTIDSPNCPIAASLLELYTAPINCVQSRMFAVCAAACSTCSFRASSKSAGSPTPAHSAPQHQHTQHPSTSTLSNPASAHSATTRCQLSALLPEAYPLQTTQYTQLFTFAFHRRTSIRVAHKS